VRFHRTRLLDGDLTPAERDRRERALALAERALAAVEPEAATRRVLDGRADLDGATLFAFGKAAVPMARAAGRAVDLRGGLVVAPEPSTLPGLECFAGGHPDPAPDAARVGDEFLARARSLGQGDVALCLVSGGGSSLLERPRGMDVETLGRAIRTLRERGAAIDELNAVRRACSAIKGGGLARAIAPARVVNVVISDVAPLPPEVVASGPTCPPPRGPGAREVLAHHGVELALPPPASEVLGPIETLVAADSEMARRALPLPDREGYFEGEAHSLGRRLAAEAGAAPWVWGGETTVTVRGSGRGGRNQEVALGALAAGWSEGLLLCLGTDGVDGASDAAGALIDSAAVRAMAARGLDPEAALRANDSTPFFDALGTVLRCGPTGTNVADLILRLP